MNQQQFNEQCDKAEKFALEFMLEEAQGRIEELEARIAELEAENAKLAHYHRVAVIAATGEIPDNQDSLEGGE